MATINRPIDEIVKENYKEYARFVNIGGRTVPLKFDTLKLVQRRCLMAAYELTKNGSFTKSSAAVGICIKNYHPHGDQSIYDSMVTLVHQGLLQGHGNFGSNSGIEPIDAAAHRYTQLRLSPLIKKLAFSYIDDVPTYVNDSDHDEPVFLPAMLPLSLIKFSEDSEFGSGIGVGLKYIHPLFQLSACIKYMKLVIEKRYEKQGMPVVYRSITNSNVKELFQKGKSQMVFTSRYTISDNGKELTIWDFPPGCIPANIMKKFDTLYIDKSTENTEVVIKSEWGKIFPDDYPNLIDSLSNKLTLDMLFHDGKIIERLTVPEIFKAVYEAYRSVVNISLNKQKNELENKIKTYVMLDKIKDIVHPFDKSTYQRIMKHLSIDEKEARRLMTYSLETMCNSKELIESTSKTLSSVNNNISNIDSFCYDHYKEVEG